MFRTLYYKDLNRLTHSLLVEYTYFSLKKKLPQCDILTSSVSTVNVPLSNEQPLIMIEPLPSAAKHEMSKNNCKSKRSFNPVE